MTDSQIGLILAAITALGGSLVAALRWAVNRVTKSNDDGTTAIIANTASNATLVTKIDALGRSIERLDDFVKDEISGVHDGPPRRTPPRGIRLPSRGNHHDGEE